MIMREDDKLFSASEIGQFTFCSVSWFLKRRGYKGSSSKKLLKKKSHGMKIHDAIGKKTHITRLLLRLSYYLLLSGIVLLFIFVIVNWFGLIG
ncbi:MAG: hypothetical protein KGY65_02090 [Candidatus Thermoplasmatota archaeon]|nr:hypothetical protein [Candidatus Thermoplasmatota archaeon]MBS3801520.1 hypothetical protein [Candidatus Thermoplasmatota archaeon]